MNPLFENDKIVLNAQHTTETFDFSTPLKAIREFRGQVFQKEKTSIQMAARALRYAWFDTVLKEGGYDFLLTAHHADDNIETFMINLSRGTGLEGFTGIPEKTRNIRRPLLPFSKDDIHSYAKDQQINWMQYY